MMPYYYIVEHAHVIQKETANTAPINFHCLMDIFLWWKQLKHILNTIIGIRLVCKNRILCNNSLFEVE